MYNTQPAGQEYLINNQGMVKTKLKKWRMVSIVFGLIPPIGYIILNIIYGILSANSGGFGWVYLFLFAPIVFVVFGVCLVMTIISFVRIVAWSRKGNRTPDAIIATLAILLVFSPFLISKVWVSVRRTNSISNPYYHSSEWGGLNCSSRKTSDRYDEYDYVNIIGCMVADYYKAHKKYPVEGNIRSFLATRYPEFGRSGYKLVIDTDVKPNEADFVIQYGVNCKGEAKSSYDGEIYTKGFSIYSPLYSTTYGKYERTCISFNPD